VGGMCLLFKFKFYFLKEDEEDSLYWTRDEKRGLYTVKLRYKRIAEEEFFGERKWW